MKEYDKIKEDMDQSLGSIDGAHPMKQVAVMSVIQVLMLASVGIGMFVIGISV